jgi:hypothetical protein
MNLPYSAHPRNSWRSESIMRDPIVEQVRKAREAYAAQFDHDLNRIVADLKRRQDQGEFQVVRRAPRPARTTARARSRRVA